MDTEQTGSARRSGHIQSLERMDAILGAIASAPEGTARLTEVAGHTGLHKNTVFSLLRTLVALGYCEQSRQTGAYRIGQRTFEMARMAERNFDIVRVVRPLMRRLALQYRESLSLAVPAQEGCVVVATVEGTFAVRGSRFQGQLAPYHASALGKAVLAWMPEEERAPIVAELRYERFTSRTISDPPVLLEDCARARERGYATSVAEEERGASAVAAPVFSRSGEPAGAIAIWGPSIRLTRTRLAAIGPVLASELRALQS
jgi:IclR family acetate operon transcriptional repressor